MYVPSFQILLESSEVSSMPTASIPTSGEAQNLAQTETQPQAQPQAQIQTQPQAQLQSQPQTQLQSQPQPLSLPATFPSVSHPVKLSKAAALAAAKSKIFEEKSRRISKRLDDAVAALFAATNALPDIQKDVDVPRSTEVIFQSSVSMMISEPHDKETINDTILAENVVNLDVNNNIVATPTDIPTSEDPTATTLALLEQWRDQLNRLPTLDPSRYCWYYLCGTQDGVVVL